VPESVEYSRETEEFPEPRKENCPSAVAEIVTGWPEVETEGKAAQVNVPI
jgi:hypothetical protein